MSKKIKMLFLVLVLIQGLHSIEEYAGKLWEIFPSATFLCSLVSDNLVTGFLIINIGLFVFGLLSWFFPIRKEYNYANFLLWFWIALELVNGIGHPIWALIEGSYTPGIITAPFLFLTALAMLREKLN